MYRCLTYRSAGAEEWVYPAPIDILLRWSKEVSVLCVAFVALNISEIPRISHVELTFEKIVQTLVKLDVRYLCNPF